MMWIRSMVHSEEDITIWYGNKKKITCNSPTHFFKLIIASSSVLFSAIGMLLVQVPMISFHGHNVVSAEIWEHGLIIQWKQNLVSGNLLVSALSHHLFTFPCYLIIHFHVFFLWIGQIEGWQQDKINAPSPQLLNKWCQTTSSGGKYKLGGFLLAGSTFLHNIEAVFPRK